MQPEQQTNDLGEMVFSLCRALVQLGPGPLARLRRMDTSGPGEGDFWRLAAVHSGLRTDERGLMLVQILALLTPKGEASNAKKLHDKTKRLGAVLEAADYPETRLLRFIALPFDKRYEALERMARWLAAKGHDGVNCTDFAALLFSENITHTRQLAETYYRAKARTDATNKEDQAL